MVNTSGIYPIRYAALIKPDKVEDRTKGGIYLADSTKDRQQAAQVKGTFITAGSMAFEEIKAVAGRFPNTGERVYVIKYAGSPVKGVDGEDYQLVKDEDIVAIIDKE